MKPELEQLLVDAVNEEKLTLTKLTDVVEVHQKRICSKAEAIRSERSGWSWASDRCSASES